MLLSLHIIQRVSILDAVDIHICKFDHFFFFLKNWPLGTRSIIIKGDVFMLLFFHIIQKVSILDTVNIHICEFDQFF